MNAHFERMIQSMVWADRKTIAAITESPPTQAEALPILAHLLAAEHVWLARLQGQEPGLAIWPALTLEECRQLAAKNEAGYAVYIREVDNALLAPPVRYRNSEGREFVTAVADILTQVVVHGAYHRGQIAKILGRHAAQPPGTDFITFVRESRPAVHPPKS